MHNTNQQRIKPQMDQDQVQDALPRETQQGRKGALLQQNKGNERARSVQIQRVGISTNCRKSHFQTCLPALFVV